MNWIPLFPLDLVLLPAEPLPLHIFEERYKTMIRECLDADEEFGIVWTRENGIAKVGCTARILHVARRYPDGRMDIVILGTRRFSVEELDTDTRPYARANVEFFDDEPVEMEGPGVEERDKVVAAHQRVLQLLGDTASEAQTKDPPTASDDVAFALARSLPQQWEFKQRLLVLRSPAERVRLSVRHYHALAALLERTKRIRSISMRNGHSRELKTPE